MSEVIVLRDTVTGKNVFSDTTLFDLGAGSTIPLNSSVIIDKDFTSTLDQTDFPLPLTFNDAQAIDVEVLGKHQREGAAYAFARNSTLTKVVLTEGVPLAGLWVRVRVYLGYLVTFNYDATALQTAFPVSCLNSSIIVDAWIRGKKQREGGSFAFTRDVANNTINFTEGIPVDSWVKIRIYGNSNITTTNTTVPGGGQISFSLSALKTTDIVDAWINGTKQEEGPAFTRDAGANTIDFSETIPEGNWVQIRTTPAGC